MTQPKYKKILGEKNGNSKLTAGKVHAIRLIYASTSITQRELADMYKVTKTTIHLIVRNKMWTHI